MGFFSLAVVILAAQSLGNCKIVFIRPSTNSICNAKPCLTLSQFDGQLRRLISNATVILLQGVHSLDFNFSLANLSEFSISPNSSSQSTIICQQKASFEFKNISSLRIKGLKFVGCGRTKIHMVRQVLLKESKFVGNQTRETALEFIETMGFIVNNSFPSNKFGSFCG